MHRIKGFYYFCFGIIIFFAYVLFFTQSFLGCRENLESIHLLMVGTLIGTAWISLFDLAIKERKGNPHVWRIFLFICLQLLISLTFIVVFKCSFKYTIHLVPTHLFMIWNVVGFMMFLMFTLASIEQLKERYFLKYAMAVIGTVGTSFLLILYIVDFSLNEMGTRNITYDVFWIYLQKSEDIAHILPFSIYWIYFFLLILAVLIFVIFTKLSPDLSAASNQLVLAVRQFSVTRENKKYSFRFLILALSYMVSLLFMVKYLNVSHGYFWMGEPVANYFFYWSPITNGRNPHRVAVAKKDRRIRATYPLGKPFLKKNVILIVSDALRADHMGVYEYQRNTTPFLTNMLTHGRLQKVRYAFSECPETAAGVLSILASRSYRSLSEYNLKLNELLRDCGYSIYYILSGDWSVYERLRWLLGQDIDLFFDGNSTLAYGLNDDRLIFEGLQRVPDYKGNPAFFYFHLMSTHILGVQHARFDKYKPSELNMAMDPSQKQEVRINRYDNGVLQADAFIKDIFAALDKKGYLSECIVFILADHGDGLGEHGHYGHDRYVYQEEIRIPMLIYDSDRMHYSNLEFASQSDVAPTILERLKLPIPSSWEGQSLLSPSSKTFIYSQTRMHPLRYSVLYRNERGIYHYIISPTKEQLFELTNDSRETINLIPTADKALIELLRKKAARTFDLEPKMADG